MSTTSYKSISAWLEHLDITPDAVSSADTNNAVLLIDLPDCRPITEPLLNGINQIPDVQSVDLKCSRLSGHWIMPRSG